MSVLTGEAEDDETEEASGVNERDHSTIPPVYVFVSLIDILTV
jgi:hypothetical protein